VPFRKSFEEIAMRRIVRFIGVLLCSSHSYCQQSDSLWNISDSRPPAVRDVISILQPSALGVADPFLAIPKLIDWGDSVVESVDSILWQDGVFAATGELESCATTREKIRLFSVLVLEGIRTQLALNALINLAANVSSVELKAAAVSAIGMSFRQERYLINCIPDKELVNVLLKNIDDTVSVPSMHKTIGQLSREAFLAWTNRDAGEPQGEMSRVAATGSDGSIPLQKLREIWWASKRDQVTWDPDLKVFNLP
jgi:hypothetical protein